MGRLENLQTTNGGNLNQQEETGKLSALMIGGENAFIPVAKMYIDGNCVYDISGFDGKKFEPIDMINPLFNSLWYYSQSGQRYDIETVTVAKLKSTSYYQYNFLTQGDAVGYDYSACKFIAPNTTGTANVTNVSEIFSSQQSDALYASLLADWEANNQYTITTEAIVLQAVIDYNPDIITRIRDAYYSTANGCKTNTSAKGPDFNISGKNIDDSTSNIIGYNINVTTNYYNDTYLLILCNWQSIARMLWNVYFVKRYNNQ